MFFVLSNDVTVHALEDKSDDEKTSLRVELNSNSIHPRMSQFSENKKTIYLITD